MSTIAQMNVKLAMDSADFDRGVSQVQAKADGFTKQLGSMGTTMSLAVTAPLAGIATMALKSAGDFEASMNVLQSVSGATAGDMAALQQQALDLGATTAFSAGEAAEAMLELGKAGMGTNDIMGAMPGVLSLAAAGGMDVGTAAGIAANAVNTFNLAAGETTGVANMLAAAANASSADVSDLAAGMQMAGAVFASNGQSLSDLTTAMSLMANAGIAGSDAGTSLKTMMMLLAAPTGEAAAAMADLGLNVYNLDGSMRPFQDVVADLGTATAGLNDAQRNAALSTIFGADAIRAANILVNSGAEGWASMEAAVNQAGAAQEAANARMSGLSGALETVKGAVESLLISISMRFLPALTGVAMGLANLISGFGSLSPELQNAAIAFGAVMAAAGPLMLAISGIGAALGFLLSPIGLIVVAVAGLAAAWSTNFMGIQDITMGFVAQVGPALQAVLTPLQWVAEAMLDAGVNSTEASEAITALPAALQPVATGFQTLYAMVTAGAAALGTFLAPAIGRVQEAFAGLGPKLGELAGPLAGLQQAFVTLWTVVQPILAQLAAAIGVSLAVAADAGLNTIAAVITNLPALIGPAINQVTSTIMLIATTVQGVANLVKAIIAGDWDAAWKSAQDIVAGFSTYFTNTVANWQAIASAVFTTIKQIVETTLTDMGTSIESVMSSISAFWTGIWEGMSKAIQPVLDAIDGLKKGIQGFQDWISSISIPNPFAGIQMPSLPALPSLPGFAAGGSVTGGAPIIVGERGPEIFTPSRSGTIIPNNELGDWMTPGGMGASGAGASVTIENVTMYNEIDLQALAYQVAQLLGRRR
jgi:TP901 family phage tail tape measure protein